MDVADLLHDPEFQGQDYDPWDAFVRSKAANILFAVARDLLGRRHGVRAFAVHPGGIPETGLARHMDLTIAQAHGMIDERGNGVIDPEKGWKTPQQGAATLEWTATSPRARRGRRHARDPCRQLGAATTGGAQPARRRAAGLRSEGLHAHEETP
ncbi:hypothetical protein [Gemmatirosa kalamazoonensis]|uniref:hypothetical protein n=1 Tax=Gemmatirosa kalamazoonensis TaxID=861299 RepID=UPI0004B4C3E8|nr:hypothetical protein [Gemmatirosa kalamazoonensis]